MTWEDTRKIVLKLKMNVEVKKLQYLEGYNHILFQILQYLT